MSSVQVQLTDVTLRDGLQVEKPLSTEDKKSLFHLLSQCGYSRLEFTSFSHPKWMPQFADSEDLCKSIFSGTITNGIELMAFVPNEKGLTRLLAFPIPWVSAFVAVSETFNQKNVNTSIEETLTELKKVIQGARGEKRKVRVYVSTVFGCPYEGNLREASVFETLKKVVDLGPDEIALSDTIGVATPSQMRKIISAFKKLYPQEKTAVHLHNTYAGALGAASVALEEGILKFDGSTGSIGGCPYAKGATGNAATEELAYLFHREGLFQGFRKEPIHAALNFLKDRGLRVQSHILDILEKGGSLYGIH